MDSFFSFSKFVYASCIAGYVSYNAYYAYQPEMKAVAHGLSKTRQAISDTSEVVAGSLTEARESFGSLWNKAARGKLADLQNMWTKAKDP